MHPLMVVLRTEIDAASCPVPEVLVPSPPPGHRPKGDLSNPEYLPPDDPSFSPCARYLEAVEEWRHSGHEALTKGRDEIMLEGGGSKLDVVQRAQRLVQSRHAAALGALKLFQGLLGYVDPAAVTSQLVSGYDRKRARELAERLHAVALVVLEEAEVACTTVEEQARDYLYERVPEHEVEEEEEEEEEDDEEEEEEEEDEDVFFPPPLSLQQQQQRQQQQQQQVAPASVGAVSSGGRARRDFSMEMSHQAGKTPQVMKEKKKTGKAPPATGQQQHHQLQVATPAEDPPPVYQPREMSEAQVQQMQALLHLLETSM